MCSASNRYYCSRRLRPSRINFAKPKMNMPSNLGPTTLLTANGNSISHHYDLPETPGHHFLPFSGSNAYVIIPTNLGLNLVNSL